MKVKLKDVLDSQGQNQQTGEMYGLPNIVKLQLPGKIAYALGRLIREVNTESELYQKTRNELFDRYGQTNEQLVSTIKSFIQMQLTEIGVEESEGTKTLTNKVVDFFQNMGLLGRDMRTKIIKPDQEENYKKEIEEMLDQEIGIWYNPLPADTFDKFNISPLDISLIIPFLDEPKDEVKLVDTSAEGSPQQ